MFPCSFENERGLLMSRFFGLPVLDDLYGLHETDASDVANDFASVHPVSQTLMELTANFSRVLDEEAQYATVTPDQ